MEISALSPQSNQNEKEEFENLQSGRARLSLHCGFAQLTVDELAGLLQDDFIAVVCWIGGKAKISHLDRFLG